MADQFKKVRPTKFVSSEIGARKKSYNSLDP